MKRGKGEPGLPFILLFVLLSGIFISGSAPRDGRPGRSGVAGGAIPVHLKCEYLESPLGIDSEHPRLIST